MRACVLATGAQVLLGVAGRRWQSGRADAERSGAPARSGAELPAAGTAPARGRARARGRGRAGGARSTTGLLCRENKKQPPG